MRHARYDYLFKVRKNIVHALAVCGRGVRQGVYDLAGTSARKDGVILRVAEVISDPIYDAVAVPAKLFRVLAPAARLNGLPVI